MLERVIEAMPTTKFSSSEGCHSSLILVSLRKIDKLKVSFTELYCSNPQMKVAISQEFCKQILEDWGVTIDVLPQLMKYVYKNTNHIRVLLDKYPDDKLPKNVKWNYEWLLGTSAIDWEYVSAHLDESWDGWWLSCNSNITWEIVENNFKIDPTKDLLDSLLPESPIKLSWDGLSHNPNLSWDIVQKYIDAPWDWCRLSSHKNMTLDILQSTSTNHYKWDPTGLIDNPNMTWEFIENNMILFDDILIPENKWLLLSRFPGVTTDIIERYIDKPWNWNALSYNRNITWDFIEKHLDKNWNWSVLSKHRCVTLDIIEKRFGNWKWDWEYVSLNSNLTCEFIERNFEKPWDWYYLSCHPNITWEHIQKHHDWPWKWEYITNNNNITCEIIDANPNKEWNMGWLACRSEYNWEFIENHIIKNRMKPPLWLMWIWFK